MNKIKFSWFVAFLADHWDTGRTGSEPTFLLGQIARMLFCNHPSSSVGAVLLSGDSENPPEASGEVCLRCGAQLEEE